MGKKNFKIFGFVLVTFIVVGGAFYGGTRYGLSQKSVNPSSQNEILQVDFSLFWDAVSLVKSRYFDAKEVKDEDLLYGAIEGTVRALNDPYSSFFNPSDAKKFEQDISGSFGGIGAEIGIRNNQLLIISPLKGNPAEAVGLKAGDKILKIDDTFTTDLSVDEAVKLIRGEPDTEVKLLILRNGWEEIKEFKLTRKVIIVPTLDWEMKPGKIAYFELQNFNANASSLFYQAALAALLEGAEGMVLDLRNNPGGFLDVAINLGGWFFDRGEVVVKERFYSGEEKIFRANGNGALKDLPVVVLVNGGSASAAEILAGALRDNRGVKIIGEKTFGKGTVQEIENLKDGSTLKISIAEWLTPDGHEIEKKGLVPDFEVKLTEEDFENQNDVQLEKAIEILKSEFK